MQEHSRELEHDLRQNIDLLQNQVQEVRIIFIFSFLQKKTNSII